MNQETLTFWTVYPMGSSSWFFSAFRGFTFALVGLIALAVVNGSYTFLRVVLLTTAVYAVVGVIYGSFNVYCRISFGSLGMCKD
jgi:hypothetical protein